MAVTTSTLQYIVELLETTSMTTTTLSVDLVWCSWLELWLSKLVEDLKSPSTMAERFVMVPIHA